MKQKPFKKSKNLELFLADTSTVMPRPFAERISAGFPSPAEEYIEMSLDLNKVLINNPNATFFGRVKGNSMVDAGILNDDVLIIDKSLEPKNGKKAVCLIDGEFTIKTLKVSKNEVWLIPENKEYSPIKITKENEFMVWGTVTYVIHKA